MLTKLTIRNFKRFGEVEIELGSPVVFIGPNNSGKTSAMQALALWDIGLKRWNEKRSGKKSTPEKRPGVTVNRRDLVAIPIPDANLLWRGLHVRDVRRVNGQQRTSNIRIDITVEGVTNDQSWRCGLEFDYANDESFYCRPLRLSDGKTPDRMPVPEEAGSVQIAFLPPMSGLAATETRLDDGAVNVRIGEGRTAEVEKRQHAMGQAIEEVESALKTLGKRSPWSADIKTSDDFLVPLFESYFGKLGLPNLMAKKNFYELAEHVPDSEIDPEINEKLDAIVRVAESATPAGD